MSVYPTPNNNKGLVFRKFAYNRKALGWKPKEQGSHRCLLSSGVSLWSDSWPGDSSDETQLDYLQDLFSLLKLRHQFLHFQDSHIPGAQRRNFKTGRDARNAQPLHMLTEQKLGMVPFTQLANGAANPKLLASVSFMEDSAVISEDWPWDTQSWAKWFFPPK